LIIVLEGFHIVCFSGFSIPLFVAISKTVLQYNGVSISYGFIEDFYRARNIEFNDFSELEIKKADKYSNENVNFRRFTGSNEEAKLGHVWLNRFSSRNRVRIRDNETVIDEGNSNEVIRENK